MSRPLCVLLLLGALVYAQDAATPVEAVEARVETLRRELGFTGVVQTQKFSTPAAEFAGRVVEILVREGQMIAEGGPLLRLDTARLDLQIKAAEGRIKELQAQLGLAESRLSRATRLRERDVFSLEQQEEATFNVDALQGRLAAAQAELAQYQLDRSRATVRAPFAGEIVARRVGVGDWVSVGSPLVEIMSLDALEVRFDAPESVYASLRVGDEVRLAFDALPDLVVTGRISQIVARAGDTRTLPVLIDLSNPERRIPVGVLARVYCQAGEPYAGVIVPKDAVFNLGRGHQLYVVDEDGQARLENVSLGLGQNDWVEVVGSVRAGERVVTLGNERLRDGQAVDVRLRTFE